MSTSAVVAFLNKRFISPWELHKLSVLGMNNRNVGYISRYNERHLYPLVDDKLQTKKAAQDAGIAVPKLLGVIEGNWQLKKLAQQLEQWEQFVIKPTRGSGGKGILVITGRDFDYFIKSNGSKLEMNQLRRHINNVLSGLHSLGGKPDKVMIEALINYDDVFTDFTYEGVPDIRVIVFRGFPVMAMLRCSTHASDGRANLHQGAIGVGVDITTGRSLLAVQHNHPVSVHPDTGKSFAELAIPYWNTILELAANCFEMTGLGYLGCDIVLDRNQGPVILELNARPGLAIQIANGLGLAGRLDWVEALPPEAFEMTPAKRVAYAQAQLATR